MYSMFTMHISDHCEQLVKIDNKHFFCIWCGSSICILYNNMVIAFVLSNFVCGTDIRTDFIIDSILVSIYFNRKIITKSHVLVIVNLT